MAITIADLHVWFHQAASQAPVLDTPAVPESTSRPIETCGGLSSYYTNGYIFAPFMEVVTVSRSKN
jgi:hypothetical protein